MVYHARCGSEKETVMSTVAQNVASSDKAAQPRLPKLGFEHIDRTPTASQITKCGDLQKEPAKVG